MRGTNVPPSIAIIMAVLDCLLAAAQGVKNYGLEMGETMHLVQDAAAVAACRELCQEYLRVLMTLGRRPLTGPCGSDGEGLTRAPTAVQFDR